jgi:hypothetical protein
MNGDVERRTTMAIPTDLFKPITKAELFAMTPKELDAYWIARNRARRDAGLDHYTVLRDTTQPGWPIVASIGTEV